MPGSLIAKAIYNEVRFCFDMKVFDAEAEAFVLPFNAVWCDIFSVRSMIEHSFS